MGEWRGNLLAAGASLALVLCARDAGAQARVDPRAEMQSGMHRYFHAEKYEGLFFLGAGVASAVAGTVAVTRDTDFGRGLAIPVFALGLIQAVAGAVVFFRTDAQVARLDAQLATAPSAFREGELPRMRTVNRQFVMLEIVESVFILGGLATCAAGFALKSELAAGIGLGLAVEAGMIFTLDQFAHARGRVYQHALEGFAVTAGPTASGAMGYEVVWGRVF